MEDQRVRLALERHWAASDAGDFDVEHEIYHDDALLEYPQSGDRIHVAARTGKAASPSPTRSGLAFAGLPAAVALWVTEFVLTYDGKPSYAVSIMEFHNRLVARETQYFTEQFAPSPSWARLVER
ncbi:hypothetical protein GA0061101_13523 [Rhizobium lusitanum]|uniref:Nuclear transport factor 2 family protein n=1 Tax=Rhizobium lusitanum TaxID=293958 RepID=A0A1C3XF22_9HYPH|nr:hypothetical protein GA0061101_13523 [Rhizobium lusitanum]